MLPANEAGRDPRSLVDGALRLVDRRFLAAAHRAQVPVHVWTVNEPARMRQLLDLGVDGLITDRVDLALDVVRERSAA